MNTPLGKMETTPVRISDCITKFTAQLDGCTSPEWGPVEPLPDREVGRCHRNVAKMIAVNGGDLIHGWCIWEYSGLYLTAEFHAVWRTPAGHPERQLFCLTPKPDGERHILSVPTPGYGPDFDFHNKRPHAQRVRTYQPTPVAIETILAALTESKRKYESRRAAAKKMSLEEWLAAKRSADALALAIDAFLATSDELDRMLVPHPRGRWCADPDRYASVQKRKLAERRHMESLAWQMAKSKNLSRTEQVVSASHDKTGRNI
jgi:hypothetical protein